MQIKLIIEEDFVNYRKPSMLIAFPYCTFKCERECGVACCQNSDLANSPSVDIQYDEIIERYKNNKYSESIVCGGLEPFDSWNDLLNLIIKFRETSVDDFVIYTGYNPEEVKDKIKVLSSFKNIIVKFGRYIPGQKPHYDEVLGIELASDNQYAERIS